MRIVEWHLALSAARRAMKITGLLDRNKITIRRRIELVRKT
jgi:hypothetical protein